MKKIFTVHFDVPGTDKPEPVIYIAETFSEVICAIPVERGSQVVAISKGPVVDVL